jgi:nucleotide-binding universal stress UspA family protein
MTNAQRTTVIAYDGSAPAAAALSCAARRAGPGARLVVAYAANAPAHFTGTAYEEKALEGARQRAATVLDGLDSVVGEDVEVETQVLTGPPARALVRLAQEVDATEIVVGSRGFGGLRGAVLGSTSHALLHESDRPVIVIAPRAVQRQVRRQAVADSGDRLTVVVGYDGSDNAREALEYAADSIGTTDGGRVVAVYAYDAPADWLGDPYYQRALDAHQRRGRELLRELETQGLTNGELETDLVEGPPVEALVRAAHAAGAEEIVVGSRGLGRFRAALGSVSHALLQEADVPVVVVPARSAN